MTETHRLADVGFHAGELAVQHRAGVTAQAARLAPMLDPAELDGGIARFLADRTFAALTGRDRAGRLWVTPLTGPLGFIKATWPTTLEVSAALVRRQLRLPQDLVDPRAPDPGDRALIAQQCV